MATANLHHPTRIGSQRASWSGVVAIVLDVIAVALISGAELTAAMKTWYRTVPKPIWTVPHWLFGFAWAILYAMTVVAASLVWLARERDDICCPVCFRSNSL